MRIGPTECGLDDLVDLVETHIGGEFESPPHRRLGACQICPDPQRYRLRAAGPAAHRRLALGKQLLDRRRAGQGQLLRKHLDIGRPESPQRFLDDPMHIVVVASHAGDSSSPNVALSG